MSTPGNGVPYDVAEVVGRARDVAHELARDLAQVRARVRALGRIRARARAGNVARNLVDLLADDVDLAHARAHRLVLVLNVTTALDVDVDAAQALAHARERAHELFVDLDRHDALGEARNLARYLDDVHARVAQEGGMGGRPSEVAVARSARKLVAVSALLLPPPRRARYAEEFGRDLWELAAAGESTPGQLRYALRLLVRAPGLRAELEVARRRSASP